MATQVPDTRAASAQPMARLATGLLVVMAVVFVAADSVDERYAWAGYVRAFAEASMVGGLADWFAVTALFRHPLGVPIPHTAIIPNNKERIAVTLASFLRTNFLVPEVIAGRLARLDIAGAAARWLTDPARAGKLRGGITDILRQFMGALDDSAISGSLRASAAKRLRDFEVSPILGQLIDTAIENQRHGALLDAGLRWAARTLTENEAHIREMVRERVGWFIRMAGLDAQISDQIIAALTRLLDDMASDPAHPMRVKATTTLVALAFDFKHDAETREKVEGVKREIIDHPAVSAYLDGLWATAKTAMLRALDNPDAVMSGTLGQTVERIGRTLETDPELRGAINGYAQRAIVRVVDRYADEIVALVSDTIRQWETRTIVDKLEGIVGRDLQYIRMNGTIIGGLVGLTIHALSDLL